MYQPPLIPQLTPDERPWRIDWFGEVAYPVVVQRFRQPSIKVAISPLKDPGQPINLFSRIETDVEQQRDVWMPVGSLPLLRIGDIWKGGAVSVKPLYESYTFEELHIHPQTVTYLKAGVSVDEHFLLPFGEHPWHHRHTHSYCVLIDAGDVSLVVPGAEMIRFYYGSTSQLVLRLFTGAMSPERLWQAKHYNQETGHLHLKLAERLYGVSAPDIGRIALCDTAYKAASYVYHHCASALAQRLPAFPYMGFPFHGSTTLTASGIWLSFKGQEKATFLAFHIDSCSHPFPFRSLTYEADDRKVRSPQRGAATGADGGRRTVDRGKQATLSNSDAGKTKSSRSSVFDAPTRFPDLKRKQVWRERIVSCKSSGIFVRHKDGELEQVALGEAQDSVGARGGNVEARSKSSEGFNTHNQLPRWVRAGIDLAYARASKADESVIHRLLKPPGENSLIVQLPIVVDEDGVVDENQLHDMLDGQKRTLKIFFIGIYRCDQLLEKFLVVEPVGSFAYPDIYQVEKIDMVVALNILSATSQSQILNEQ
ncbi:hypothetical protein Dsui_0914 [Azospira oryzae PS]|uniref:Uncharacterized protein n=1 Tax=Azospira oryzae (strain ATCC BAA-33 / DSM 13638 / PS) TaxID=640081 RepID=G8QIV2_AZOOP|nr:hypothetical protein [Azospira oryzae]AEV25320.1 hypothetical protein Dsui_0914 [Azospira oryzae PS]